MSCPDENRFARFVEGLLRSEEACEIERHLDTCPRCADLSAEFGSLFGGEAGPSVDTERFVARVEAAMCALHVAWSLVLWTSFAALREIAARASELAWAYLGYSGLWAPAGALFALIAAVGLRRRRLWARRLAVVHALISLPSITLSPLAVVVIVKALRATRTGDLAGGSPGPGCKGSTWGRR